MTPWALGLLAIKIVAHGLIQHRLELATLRLSQMSQSSQYLGRGLLRELFTHSCDHGKSFMIYLDMS